MSQAIQIATDFIKHWEGCKLQAYSDQGGRVTIGWGSTGPGIELGVTWSQQEADDRLSQDVASFCGRVQALVKVPVNDNQLAALTSFAYNLGVFNLKSSGLLKMLNLEKYQAAADQFLLWTKIGMYVSPGLVNRRTAERALFLSKQSTLL
jgi:lysozyme